MKIVSLPIAARAGLLSLSMTLTSTPVRAHPGQHGHDWLSAVMHLLTEPDHLAGIALVAVIAGALWARRSRRGK